jgi:hypothetical protein
MKPDENKTCNQQNALNNEKGECRPINPLRLMKLTLNRTSVTPKLALLKLNEKLERQCRAESLENIRDKISDEKEKRAVNHQRKCKVISLKNPANSRARKAELAPMLCDVAGIINIPRPKLSACHLSFVGILRVPGLFVGGGLSRFGMRPGTLSRIGLGGGSGAGRDGGEGCLGGVGLCGVGINPNGAKPSNEKS